MYIVDIIANRGLRSLNIDHRSYLLSNSQHWYDLPFELTKLRCPKSMVTLQQGGNLLRLGFQMFLMKEGVTIRLRKLLARKLQHEHQAEKGKAPQEEAEFGPHFTSTVRFFNSYASNFVICYIFKVMIVALFIFVLLNIFVMVLLKWMIHDCPWVMN